MINKFIGIGRLTKDPEVRDANGTSVANFTLAINESWKDKSGQKQERVEFIRVVVWGTLGQLCHQYLLKGKMAYVEGKVQTRKWQDKEGRDNYTTEVNAQNVRFLSGKQEGAEESQEQYGGEW